MGERNREAGSRPSRGNEARAVTESCTVHKIKLFIGNSDELKEGNFVYVIGNPLGDGINIRDGTVNALRWQGGKPLHPDAKEEYFFIINDGVMPGDSGASVLAIRDGKYEFVGVVSAAYMPFNELGFVVKINVVRDVIQACAVCPSELKRLFATLKRKKIPHL